VRDLRDESERQYKSRKRDNASALAYHNGSNQENHT
jgi:hypothetical protein